MKFDDKDKVIIETMDTAEAQAFIKFLDSEIHRHLRDVREAMELQSKIQLDIIAKQGCCAIPNIGGIPFKKDHD